MTCNSKLSKSAASLVKRKAEDQVDFIIIFSDYGLWG